MVTIEYRLSEAGQKASLLAGGNGKSFQLREVTPNDAEYAAAVMLSRIDSSGKAVIDDKVRNTHYTSSFRAWDREPTILELLNDRTAVVVRVADDERNTQAALQQQKADREAEDAARVEEALATGPAYFVVDDFGYSLRGLQNNAQCAELYKQAQMIVAENIRQRNLDKAAAETARLLPLKQWATGNGSELLKARIAGDFEWVALAHTEYMQSVVDGLGDESEDRECDKVEDRDTPTLEEIEWYNNIKQTVGDRGTCDLYRCKYTNSEDCVHTVEWVTECCVTVQCPDGYNKKAYLAFPDTVDVAI